MCIGKIWLLTTNGNERLLIMDEAFADCQNLESVKILGKDVFISSKVFANCPNLKLVTISKNTLYMSNTFENCNENLEIKMVDLEKGLRD